MQFFSVEYIRNKYFMILISREQHGEVAAIYWITRRDYAGFKTTLVSSGASAGWSLFRGRIFRRAKGSARRGKSGTSFRHILYPRTRSPSASVGRDCFLAGDVMRFSAVEIDADVARVPTFPLFRRNGLSGRVAGLDLSFYLLCPS